MSVFHNGKILFNAATTQRGKILQSGLLCAVAELNYLMREMDSCADGPMLVSRLKMIIQQLNAHVSAAEAAIMLDKLIQP